MQKINGRSRRRKVSHATQSNGAHAKSNGNALLEVKKKLDDSSRQLAEFRRRAPKTIVAQLIQGFPPETEKLELVYNYLNALEGFEISTKKMVDSISAAI